MVLPPSPTIPISPSGRHSASVVAADNDLYGLWSEGAKIQELANDSQELKEMVNESRKFPLWLKDEAKEESNVFSRLFLELKYLLKQSQYSFEETPTNTHFRESMPHILMLSQHCCHFREETSGGIPTPKAVDLQVSIDALISFIFRTLEPYEGNEMRQIYECPLTLPASSLELSSAIADLAVCIRMRNFPVHLPRHVRDEIIAIDLDPADRRSPELLVLHWLVEHKEETVGYRQLSFCLAAAVHQRRALGFPEHYVFGAAHVEAGEITTYAATWSQSYSQVLVYRLETYSLEKPAHAASFFLFMRCVAKKALEYQAQLAKKEKKSLPPFAPEYQTWKAPPPPPVPLPSDCGSQKRKRSDDDIGSVYNSVSEHGDFMQDERLWSQEVA